MLAVEIIRRGARRHGPRTAVIAGNDRMTFADVDRASNRIAHVLAGLGLAPGAPVGLLIDNGLWSISVDFACLKAGVVRVPLNSRLSAAEHAQMLAGTGARVLVFSVALPPSAEIAASAPGADAVRRRDPGAASRSTSTIRSARTPSTDRLTTRICR